MKKHFFLSILFFVFVICFSGCLLPRVDLSEKEKVSVVITNKCNWSVNMRLYVIGARETINKITLKKQPVRILLYKDVEYVVSVKGAYDYSEYSINVTPDDNNSWTLKWNMYNNSYTLSRGKLEY